MSRIIKEGTDPVALDDLLKVATRIDESALPGIYFLFREGNLVYVGQSVRPEIRIQVHLLSSKVFDSYAIHHVPAELLSKYESWYILKHKPLYNESFNGGPLGLIRVGSDNTKAYMPTPDLKKAIRDGAIKVAHWGLLQYVNERQLRELVGV